MSYLSLGALSFQRPPTPGISEAQSLRDAIQAAITAGLYASKQSGVVRGGIAFCSDMPKASWIPFMRKLDELSTIYPTAIQQTPMTCINPQSLPGGQVYYPAANVKDYYNQYIASKTVNIDLTPAINTVPNGTAKSWSVTGQMPQTAGGKMYAYSFMEEASGRAYAQSIVDAGGTATLYQVPDAMPSPPPVVAPSLTQAVVVAPTSTQQGMPQQINAPAVQTAPSEPSGGFPWALLAIPAALFALKK